MTSPNEPSKVDEWAAKRGWVKRDLGDSIGIGEILGELRRPPLLWFAIGAFALIVVGDAFFGLIGLVVGFAAWGVCCVQASKAIRARRTEADEAWARSLKRDRD